MRRVRKILLPIFLICILFSGCDFSSGELKNRLIVQAVGIDRKADGGVRVTLQTLNTQMTGNPNRFMFSFPFRVLTRFVRFLGRPSPSRGRCARQI